MPETTPEAPQQNTSRRLVLKAGAHAAWAIPAIQVVSSVTQYAAASTVKANLAIKVSSSSTHNDAKRHTGTVNFVVSCTQVDATGVVVTVTGTGVKNGSASFAVPADIAAGTSFPVNKKQDFTFDMVDGGSVNVTVSVGGNTKGTNPVVAAIGSKTASFKLGSAPA